MQRRAVLAELRWQCRALNEELEGCTQEGAEFANQQTLLKAGEINELKR